ncbi:MAG: HAMP domain-containing sensor histidine kinase [Dehalococcoidales bacterium]|nr:HAMP domain-containing sensor histidine kinase [Dehalococcoidales bacterium]
MKIRLNSIKLKLTLFYTLILVVLLLIFHFTAYAFLSFGLFNNLDDSLIKDLNKAQQAILQTNDDDLPKVLDEMNGSSKDLIFIYDVETNEVLGSSYVDQNVRSTLLKFVTIGTITYAQLLNTSDNKIHLYVSSLNVDTDPGKMIVVTHDTDYIYATLVEYREILFAAIPFILLFSAISGYLLAGFFLRPAKAIIKTANSIDPAELTDRIPVKSHDELGILSGTLNSLFDKIYGFIDRQRQFAANTSHDLKSPLSIIKMEASLALKKDRTADEYKKALNSIDEEADRLNSMVKDLLALATIDSAPLRAGTTALDLSDVVNDILDRWRAPFAVKGIQLERSIATGMKVTGDGRHFSGIVDNLVKNAYQYTPSGGRVTCSLEGDNDNIVLKIADTGIGIDKEHLSRIFDRFYRVDKETSGNGLGLPIVEGTVKMYGGRITVESELGKGSMFTVYLPKGRYFV